MYSIISLSISGLLTLFLGFSENKKIVFPASILFMVLALGLAFVDWNAPGFYFSSMLEASNENIVFSAIVISSAILVMMLSDGFKDFEFAQPAEYYALVQLSLVGAIMMICFENLIMLFLGIEILSVALYVLTGSDKRNIRGNEAAIKYFLMGAFATGILLFGMAMFYGSQGSFDIHALSSVADRKPEELGFLWIGCVFMLVGLTFKVSAAPFHFWAPDVYDGAPTIFTAFMATVVKTAGFVAIYRILSITFLCITDFWWVLIAILTAISLVVGNLTAVKQDSFKRLMAYSSISHAGFMLMALIGDIEKASGTIMFYSVAYTLSTVAAFGVLMAVSKNKLKDGRHYEKIDLFEGLGKNNGLLTGVLVVAMLSLSGIPLTAGFWGKFFVFSGVASTGFYAFLILAILMSAVSIYYYFKPIAQSFNKSKDELQKVELPMANKVILILCTLGTILLGIFPNVLRSIF